MKHDTEITALHGKGNKRRKLKQAAPGFKKTIIYMLCFVISPAFNAYKVLIN